MLFACGSRWRLHFDVHGSDRALNACLTSRLTIPFRRGQSDEKMMGKHATLIEPYDRANAVQPMERSPQHVARTR